eukprot:242861_1
MSSKSCINIAFLTLIIQSIVVKGRNMRSFLPLLSPGFHVATPYDPPSNTTHSAITDVAFYDDLLPHMSVYQFGFTWLDYEATPNIIDSSTPVFYLNIADNTLNLQPFVGISIINTNQLSIPSDLVTNNQLSGDLLFNSTAFLTRYFAVLSDIIPQIIAHRGFYVILANEFNGYSQLYDIPGYADSFVDFVERSMNHIHNTLGYKDLAVGVTIMHGGLASLTGIAWYDRLLSVVDVMSVTYYPLQSDFSVQNPSVARHAFQEIIEYIPSDMAIIIQEFGYPSGYLYGSTNNSSQSKQAAFFTNMLEEFISSGAVQLNAQYINQSRLRVASVFKMVDWSADTCTWYGSYYQITDPRFMEYLCTLGLFTFEGVEKLSYQVVKDGFMNMESFLNTHTSAFPSESPTDVTLIPSHAPTTSTVIGTTSELESTDIVSSFDQTLTNTANHVLSNISFMFLVSLVCSYL